MYPLFETIKIESMKPQNIGYHQQRLDLSYEQMWGEVSPFLLEDIIHPPQNGILRCRFSYSQDSFCVDYLPYTKRHIESLMVVHVDNIDYSLKYSDRSAINMLFDQRGQCSDVLIVHNSLITDTSVANVYLFDGNGWVTPQSPLLDGSVRSRLLELGVVVSRDIHIDDLHKFEKIALSNAMIGFDVDNSLLIDKVLF